MPLQNKHSSIDKFVNKLNSYMQNTDAEHELNDFLSDLLQDNSIDNKDVLDHALEFFDKHVPDHIKNKLFDDINKEFL